MSIAYATAHEVKAAAPETFDSSTTHDVLLRQLCERASRYIDRLTARAFWPATDTRYFPGTGNRRLFVDDLLAITAVYRSVDNGESWSSALGATDYFALGGDNLVDGVTPYACIELSPVGSYLDWPHGPRAAKITGIWGYHDVYADAWELSADTIENTPKYSSGGTSFTVNDADGEDSWGFTPRFQFGQLLLVGTEQFAVTTVNAGSTNTLVVAGAQHGTTAADHSTNDAIYIWRAAQLVRQAVIMQALRWFKRGQQSFQDTGAVAELGQLTFTQELDPEIRNIVNVLRRRR